MNKSTLINTLRSFSLKEMREFGEFVHSPFHNKNQAAGKLFDYLKKYYPEFDAAKIGKEDLYKRLFGKSEYNESFMKTIIHILSSLSEQFLLQMNMNKKPAMQALLICEELNERKLEKQLAKSFKAVLSEIDLVKESDESLFHYYMYQYYSLAGNYLEWTKFKNKNFKDFEDDNFSKIIQALAGFSFEEILINYRAVLARREQAPLKFDERIPEHIIEFLIKNEDDFSENPSLRLHLFELMFYRDQSDENFRKLKNFLLSEEERIPNDKKFTLNTILQQYCIKRGSEGEKEFNIERFGLYKLALEKGFYKLKSQIYIDQLLFGSIALTALALGELEWTEEFIGKYGNELPPESTHQILGYTKARLYFERKEFEHSLKLLNSISTLVHVQVKIPVRNLLLMIYFELNYFDQGEDLHSSYRKFIAANPEHFSDSRLERQQNFLKFYLRLLKIKASLTGDGLDELIVSLNSTTNTIERGWLVEKSVELEDHLNK